MSITELMESLDDAIQEFYQSIRNSKCTYCNTSKYTRPKVGITNDAWHWWWVCLRCCLEWQEESATPLPVWSNYAPALL